MKQQIGTIFEDSAYLVENKRFQIKLKEFLFMY